MPMTPRCQPSPATTSTERDANLRIGLDDLARLGDDVLLFLPASRVLGFQLLGQAARLVRHALVGGQQQSRRDVRRAHSSRSVDARREHEGDVVAVDLFAGQAGDVEQRAQAHLVRPLRQQLQPELGDDAIFADEGHDVGKCADRGDLDECRQPGGLARARAQRLDEL